MVDVNVATPTASSPAATVSKATARAARLLGLNNASLAVVLGLSEATISRLMSGSFTLEPTSKLYELALLIIRLFRSLDAMVGGEEVPMRGWMRLPNALVGGGPAEMIRTVSGLVETVSYVDNARSRI